MNSAATAEPAEPRDGPSARLLLAAFLAVHVAIWTLVPTLLHAGLPLDLVEGYAIGHEWVIGYFKHPALPWWLTEALRRATGLVDAGAYGLSAASVALTYWLAWRIGRDMMSEARAAAGALLLSGVMYFSWVVPEFNHNVAQMPLWLAFVLSIWRARQTDAVAWWIALGLVAALGLYAKLAHAVLLVAAIVYALADAKLRSKLLTSGPWIGLTVFAVASLPLAWWLVASDFLPFDYVATRTRSSRGSTVAVFLLKQAGSLAGLLVLLAVARTGVNWPGAPGNDGRSRDASVDADARRFLGWLFVVPLALVAALAAFTGTGLRGSWGTPMLSLAGPLAMTLVPLASERAALHRIAFGAFALLIVVPVAYAFVTLQPSGRHLTPKRTSWPQAEIAREMQAIWRKETGMPLRIVAGDLWVAGMVAAHARDRPSVLVEGSLRFSPWIDRQRLAREGFMAVWWRAASDPPDYLRSWIGTRIDGRQTFKMRNGDRREAAVVHYTIVRPGTLDPAAGPPDR